MPPPPPVPPPADEHATLATLRHAGRLYAAHVLPSGSTTITRDGLFLCKADWNGRALDPGDHELHADLDTSIAIQNALGAAIIAATGGRAPATRPGKDAYPDC